MICMHIGAQIPYFPPRSPREGNTLAEYSFGETIPGVVNNSRYWHSTPCVYNRVRNGLRASGVGGRLTASYNPESDFRCSEFVKNTHACRCWATSIRRGRARFESSKHFPSLCGAFRMICSPSNLAPLVFDATASIRKAGPPAMAMIC